MTVLPLKVYPLQYDILVFLFCTLLCMVSDLSASPGVETPVGAPLVHVFLKSQLQKVLAYSITGSGQIRFPSRRQMVGLTARLIEGEGPNRLLLYQSLGDKPFGIPTVMTLRDFAAFKFQNDGWQQLNSQLGEKVEGTGDSEFSLNVEIPIRVPRGLSAITGQGETNLSITGRRRVELSGLSQYTLGQAQSARTRTSRFPIIQFEQESQLNVEGNIGDRITIALEQNSQSSFDLSESLRLHYRGEEDGIIDIIEAGNTTLSLPGTRLIGFSGGGRGGLFGIKTIGKVGNINFTVVTSQDKGSSNRKSFRGQAEEIAHQIRDYEYLEDTYFFLDEIYRDDFGANRLPSDQTRVNVRSVRVFLNDFNPLNDIEDRVVAGLAYAFWRESGDPDIARSREVDKGLEEGFFHELDPQDFTVFPEGYIIYERGRINPGFTLAVTYSTEGGQTFGDPFFIPDPNDPDSKIRLKLIKAKQQRPDSPTWPLSWRNVYSLGSRSIEPEGFALSIFREVPGQEPLNNQEGVHYLQIFNLDRRTNGSSDSSPPDNLIDIPVSPEIPGLNLVRGHIVFADLEPFGAPGVGAKQLDDGDRVPRIYSETNRANRSEASRFLMRVRSASRATEFNLGPGIIQNSETVLLNNRRLERGTDYTIEYTFGRIRFIGEAANAIADPTADLSIDYGSQSLFGGLGSSKSLLGLRLERPFDDNYSLMGMTLLYSNQTTSSQRIRVGQEPARTIIWDANARLRFQPQLLTDLVNTIPLVNTTAPSRLDLDVEVAQSRPNPNTKNVAYIDDFEGAQNNLSFQIQKLAWGLPSTPTRNNRSVSLSRGRLTWYNPSDRDRARLTEIQPGRDDITAERDVVNILVLRFDPARSNGFPIRTRDNQNGRSEPSWAGMMRYLGGFDFSRSKFLELWIRGSAGKIHIDLGELSERIDLPLDDPEHNPASSTFRTEDTPLGGVANGPGDELATDEEDIGLDGLTDAEEREKFGLIFPGSPIPDDPSGDNFQDINFNRTNIQERYPPGLNGTQANNSERNSLPDTEDLNRNGFLDQRNSYLRYSVDLSTNRGYNPQTNLYDGLPVLVEGSESDVFDVGAKNPPWRLLRIPLRGLDAPLAVEGNPDTTFASTIDFVRFWIEHEDTTTVQLYTFGATGSDWLEDPRPATAQSGDFQVTTIGTDNINYEPPPGLEREIDPTSGVRLLEHSLSLEFEDLFPDEEFSVSRSFIQGADYTSYGTMNMFVHGGNPAQPTFDTNFPSADDTLSNVSPIEFFLRFAPINDDTLNFYEYRLRVYQGWAPDANTVKIDLELMSLLKGQLLDLQTVEQASSDTLSLQLPNGEFNARYSKENGRIEVDVGKRTYIIKGNPALSNIKAFSIGIKNRGNHIILGKNVIWVDELRLDNIRKRSALSAVIDINTVLADLGNLKIGIERRSGDFQDLRGNSSGNTTTRINLDSSFNLDKLLPKSWHTAIPVRWNYNRFSSVPRIRRGSDVVLTPQQKRNESDIRSQTRFNISLRKRPAQEKPRFISRLFFDKISTQLSFSANNSTGGAITRRTDTSNDNLTGSFSYTHSWSTRPALRLFGWVPFFKPLKGSQFFYLPSSLNYQVRFNRALSKNRSFAAVAGDTSNVINTRNERFTLNENYSVKMTPFRTLQADYTLAIDRDLRNGFSVSQFQFGRETRRTQNINMRYAPRISRWLTISPSYSSNYTENLENGGQRTEYGTVRRGLSANTRSTTSARMNFNLPGLFQPLARPKGKKKGFSITQFVGKLGTSFQTITGNASRTRQLSVFGLLQRPSLAFQFGLRDSALVPSLSTGSGTRVNTRQIQDQVSGSSGLRLPMGFSVGSNMNYTHNRASGNRISEDDNFTFPKFNASWRGLERLPVFKWIWVSSNFSSGFQKSHSRRGDSGLDNLNLTEERSEKALAPLFQWSARWKGQLNTTLRSNRRRSDALRYQRNVSTDPNAQQPTLADRLIGTTQTESSDLQADLRYSIRGRFQRSLDLTLTFNWSAQLQSELPRASRTDQPPEPVIRQDNKTWQLNLSAQYAFSSQFTGGANFRHERRQDRLRDLTNVSWEFRFWGEIGFQ
ncbi:MAG: cell surface protein SprA [bacterium]|nr:cell surface protein SprA [bacterium]